MVGWHHQLSGHEFEQIPGVGDGQGGLVAVVHMIAKSQTRVTFTFTCLFLCVGRSISSLEGKL